MKDQTILIATNGLWDNVNLDEIHYNVRGAASMRKSKQVEGTVGREEEEPEPKSLEQIAKRVCQIGVYYSQKGNYESPVWRRGQEVGLKLTKEGYLDDVSLLMARVGRTVEIDCK